jgi:hypothetical protein
MSHRFDLRKSECSFCRPQADDDHVRLRLAILVIGLSLCVGCWTPRPYASDPLVRHRRATVGDFEKPGCPCQYVEPLAPGD